MRIMVSETMGIKRLDPMNVVIFEERECKKKDGTNYMKDVTLGYYHTIEKALESLSRRFQADLTANSIPELIQEIKNLNKAIYETYGGLKI